MFKDKGMQRTNPNLEWRTKQQRRIVTATCSFAFLVKLVLFTVLAAGIGWSQSVNATMTLYKDGFALLKQPVAWRVPAGKSTVKYNRLPAGLFVDSPFLNLKGTRILSQRLDNNVFSGDQYFKGKLGEVVEVKIRGEKPQTGILLDYTPATITIQKKNTVKNILRERIDYIAVKDELKSPQFAPVLMWKISSSKARKAKGELIYLSGGFDWNAVYRMILDAPSRTAELIPEAYIANKSNLDFSDLKLQLVEGNLRRAGRRPAVSPVERYMSRMKVGETETAAQVPIREVLGDYHIYSLAERVSLKANESMTVRLYEPRKITYEKTYLFENSERSQREEPLVVEIKFANTEENNLNIPLPGGKVELYQSTKDGTIEFSGEDLLKQIPKGETAILIAGRAFDVIGKRKVINYDRLRKSEEASIEITVKNTKDEEIQVRVIEHISGDWVIRDASTMYIKEDASTIYYPLTIPAGETQLITYTYRKQWD